MIIAIDGPSGAGKSTLGKRLAKELGLLYLDTGAMYRAAALAVLENEISIYDVAQTSRIVANSRIELEGTPDNLKVFLDGRDVTEAIRAPAVSQAASIISAIPAVRRLLVERQRELGARGAGCVLDGRDIGTVVFPNADIKIFLTATPESRAARRFAELNRKNVATSYDETLSEINERDLRDSSRHDSPLKQADDAVIINSTELDLEQTYEQMLRAVQSRAQSANQS